MFYFILKGITYVVDWLGRLYSYIPDMGFRKNIVWQTGGSWFTQYFLFWMPLRSAGIHYMCLKDVTSSNPTLTKASYEGEYVKNPVLAIEVNDLSNNGEYDITDLWNKMLVPKMMNTVDMCYLAEWYCGVNINCWNSMVNVIMRDGSSRMYNGLVNVGEFEVDLRNVGRSLKLPAVSPPIVESREGSPDNDD